MVVSPSNHSNRHFHKAQVQLQHLCHRHFNSHIRYLQARSSNRLSRAKWQHQQSRGQPTSLLIIDDQQAGPSRQLTFTLTLTKHFNPSPVASATNEQGQHKISGLSSFLGNIPSVLSYQQIDTPQPFSPADTQPSAAYLPTTTASHQPPAQLQPPPESANTKQQPQWSNCHCLQSSKP